MPNSKPNILILMTDQQRADAMGCSGNPKIRTPHMDALAASGVRFSQAVTPTPVCVAARMSFITGHRAARTRWMANSSLPGPLPELPTLISLLLQSGYWTQGIGKMHFRGRHHGLRDLLTMEEGVTHWIDDDYITYLREQSVRTRYPKGLRDLLFFQPQTCGIPVEHHMNTWVADRSVDFLRQHSRYRSNQPFFLWSSWISPHPPFAPCEPYDDMYDPVEMDLPNFADRPIETLSPTLYGSRGRILAELDTLGLSDNTVVLFTSDHGDRITAWEKQHGPPGSLEGDVLKTYPGPDRVPAEAECRTVNLNDGPWPKRVPEDEQHRIETYAEAFTRAISKESSLSPDKLSIGQYKEKILQLGPHDSGGESLEGTPWEDAWNRA